MPHQQGRSPQQQMQWTVMLLVFLPALSSSLRRRQHLAHLMAPQQPVALRRLLALLVQRLRLHCLRQGQQQREWREQEVHSQLRWVTSGRRLESPALPAAALEVPL